MKFMYYNTLALDAIYILLIGDLYSLSMTGDRLVFEQLLPGINLDPNDKIIYPLGLLAMQVEEEY